MPTYFIAHRGNLYGPNPKMENRPDYIMSAISEGFDVEIDVWVIGNDIFLGHDEPQYKIDLEFLQNPKLWCHAKNFEALTMMLNYRDTIHCFSHDNDKHVLTSNGFIMAYPGEEIDKKTICIMPERCEPPYKKHQLKNCLGICSDDIARYRILYNH